MRLTTSFFLGTCMLFLVVGRARSFAQSTEGVQNITTALSRIRQTYHISTGFENADADTTPVTLDLSSKDPGSIFDAVVAQNPVYVWSFEDGVYELYPRNRTASLSQLTVAHFILTNAKLEDARESLFELPEVRNWFSQHKARRNLAAGGSVFMPGRGAPPLPEPTKIALNVNNLQLRGILSQIIIKFDRTQWIISHVARKENGQDIEYVSIEP